MSAFSTEWPDQQIKAEAARTLKRAWRTEIKPDGDHKRAARLARALEAMDREPSDKEKKA